MTDLRPPPPPPHHTLHSPRRTGQSRRPGHRRRVHAARAHKGRVRAAGGVACVAGLEVPGGRGGGYALGLWGLEDQPVTHGPWGGVWGMRRAPRPGPRAVASAPPPSGGCGGCSHKRWACVGPMGGRGGVGGLPWAIQTLRTPSLGPSDPPLGRWVVSRRCPPSDAIDPAAARPRGCPRGARAPGGTGRPRAGPPHRQIPAPPRGLPMAPDLEEDGRRGSWVR